MADIPIDPVIRKTKHGPLSAHWISLRDWVLALGMTVLVARKRRAGQKLIAGLSGRQLRDAGIDPACAGRGRAADVTTPPRILDLR